MKPALARLRESRAARARELSEEVLAVQERLDAGLEALTERTEDNAALGTQVSPLGKHAFSSMSAWTKLAQAMLYITHPRELMRHMGDSFLHVCSALGLSIGMTMILRLNYKLLCVHLSICVSSPVSYTCTSPSVYICLYVSPSQPLYRSTSCSLPTGLSVCVSSLVSVCRCTSWRHH